MQKTTFATVFGQILAASDMSLRQAHAYLEERGVQVPYQTLSAYKTFSAVPAYDRALDILKAFDYEIADEDLSELLQYSATELKQYREDARKYLNRGVRINPKFFSEDMTSDDLEFIINQRIEESGDGTLNTYLMRLIKEDLTKNGFLGEENE